MDISQLRSAFEGFGKTHLASASATMASIARSSAAMHASTLALVSSLVSSCVSPAFRAVSIRWSSAVKWIEAALKCWLALAIILLFPSAAKQR